jgi:hypothetical protein
LIAREEKREFALSINDINLQMIGNQGGNSLILYKENLKTFTVAKVSDLKLTMPPASKTTISHKDLKTQIWLRKICFVILATGPLT